MAKQAATVKHDGVMDAFLQFRCDAGDPMPQVEAVRRSFHPDYKIRLNDVRRANTKVRTDSKSLPPQDALFDLSLNAVVCYVKYRGTGRVNKTRRMCCDEILIVSVGLQIRDELPL